MNCHFQKLHKFNNTLLKKRCFNNKLMQIYLLIPPYLWPLNSPDLNPVHYIQDLGGYAAWSLPDEGAKIWTIWSAVWIDVWAGIQQSLNNDVINQRCKRLRACVRARGGHFEHSLWLSHLSDFANLTLRFNSMFAPERANNWNMTVSQGSAAMSLRCGGLFNDCFVSNFALSLAGKEFWKSLNISWSNRHE